MSVKLQNFVTVQILRKIFLTLTIMPREYGFFPFGSTFNRCRRGVGVGLHSFGGSGMQWLYIFPLLLLFSFN